MVLKPSRFGLGTWQEKDAMAVFSQAQKTPDFTSRVSEANEAGEKFVEVFYETFDKRRQV